MPDHANTPIAPDAQDFFPLPPYRETFRLHTWLSNTVAGWPWDLIALPEDLQSALVSVECLVQAALEREGKTYGEMLRAIHAGEFDNEAL